MENTMTISMTVAPRADVVDDARRDAVALPQTDSAVFGRSGGGLNGADLCGYGTTIKYIDLSPTGFSTHLMWPAG